MKDRKSDVEDSQQDIDNDEIQSSLLAHYIQTYLSHSTNENTCGCLPIPFERASSHSWIRPCFDSDILEDQFKTSSANHFRRRFRFALLYLIVASASWLCFSLYRYPTIFYIPIIFGILLLVLSFSFYHSKRSLYKRRPITFATLVAVILACGALAFCLFPSSTLSHFTVVSYTVIVIYTIFPLPPYISLVICVALTVAFNAMEYFRADFVHFPQGFFVRILCLVCTNIIGFHIVVMVHIRMRGTFMKVGQRLLVRRQLEAEKQLKEKMIHSVMPPKVASWLLNPNPSLSDSTGQRPSNSSTGDIRTLFRPFNMVRMENVSILFADIVGFTRMSSNKTAEQIVDILNDLFNRFDELCILSGCEKISTLGDCYYCVSGCPEPRQDHAKCCVEMGLGMIEAIQEFDVERSEDVNMRVGVHTGTVLCGVVGTRRFKFDVWSNDVSFANKLESTGLAGRVHVSEQTIAFLDNSYQYEEFSCSIGVKTYLIATREPVPMCQVRMALPPSPLVTTPAISRKRLHSYNSGQKRPHYLSLITDVRSKFASLPNVLTGASGSTPQLPTAGTRSSVPHKAASIRWQFPFPKSWRPKDDVINLEAMEHLEVPKQEHVLTPDEEVSLCPSATSRKDSGIKSTSRRSSIQQQIYIMNGLGQQELGHRVSGYFTSSRSSLPHSESECDASVPCRLPRDDGLGACFYTLRKQSDLQLIRCVRDISQRSYFVKVPLRSMTLRFRSEKMEGDYRKHAHHINENVGDSPVTLSTPRYDTLLDILVATIVLIAVTCGLLLLHPPNQYYSILTFLALFVQMTTLALCCLYLSKGTLESTKPWSRFIISLFSNWYKWHALGVVLVSLPMMLTLVGFTYGLSYPQQTIRETADLAFLEHTGYSLPDIEYFDYYYTFLLLVSLTHFCNFIQLNSLLKGIIAVFSIVVFASLIYVEQGELANKTFVSTVYFTRFISDNIFVTPADGLGPRPFCCANVVGLLAQCEGNACFDHGKTILDNFNQTLNNSSIVYATANGHKILNFMSQTQVMFPESWKSEFINAIANFITYDHYELLLNILIVLLLVIWLNRDLETNYRASYYFNVESNKDKVHVQYLKNQADMLLENIIPKHVSEELKNRAKYCENHTDVGIIFASIVNFNMLYEETYSGGKEYLRYLNELISDFDELLTRFPNVEKIKTIGSTFMAASGLNPELRKKNAHEHAHIFELMEFAREMYRVLEDFNSDLLGFTLVLRVGFNIGEVTAGVIGSTKLLYDIWGDTVNVASRMDTTGVEGRIQVPSSCLKYLSDRYQFEPRGSVFVKGKGDIMVFLLQAE